MKQVAVVFGKLSNGCSKIFNVLPVKCFNEVYYNGYDIKHRWLSGRWTITKIIQ